MAYLVENLNLMHINFATYVLICILWWNSMKYVMLW